MTEMRRKLGIRERSCGLQSPPHLKRQDGTKKGSNDSIYFICRTIQAAEKRILSFNFLNIKCSRVTNNVNAPSFLGGHYAN